MRPARQPRGSAEHRQNPLQPQSTADPREGIKICWRTRSGWLVQGTLERANRVEGMKKGPRHSGIGLLVLVIEVLVVLYHIGSTLYV